MPHWLKRNPPASQFNVYLTDWTLAFSIIFLGTLAMLSLHRHV
jgi:hypothetical protein